MARTIAKKLMRQGYDALDPGDFDRAVKIGNELKEPRHTSCFEILSRAYWELDRPDDAIAVLKEGIRIAPQAFSFTTSPSSTNVRTGPPMHSTPSARLFGMSVKYLSCSWNRSKPDFSST